MGSKDGYRENRDVFDSRFATLISISLSRAASTYLFIVHSHKYINVFRKNDYVLKLLG